MKKRVHYTKEMPRQIYLFFTTYSDVGAPSFEKFARSIGATLAEIGKWRKNKEFDRAWRECSEIRKDYLIDTALTKRHDPSFVKFLLTTEFGVGEEESGSDGCFTVNVEVIDDEEPKA